MELWHVPFGEHWEDTVTVAYGTLSGKAAKLAYFVLNCNVPSGVAAGSASMSVPVRPPLLFFADSSSLPRSLLRVGISRDRIVTATALRTCLLGNSLDCLCRFHI
ncbi:hypothetical protein T05_16243 [Trichinella murrelli]|uniref:Uncharacterized protein n=1 Tax=Trichinella murrelli TaxID=144512 RepID=A0A0V0T7Y4_9BILA|nr:hypothetical protein T05_16243 [Trichinella murrelli]